MKLADPIGRVAIPYPIVRDKADPVGVYLVSDDLVGFTMKVGAQPILDPLA
jgi:hypothetical protein